jgi:hypothetical protein
LAFKKIAVRTFWVGIWALLAFGPNLKVEGAGARPFIGCLVPRGFVRRGLVFLAVGKGALGVIGPRGATQNHTAKEDEAKEKKAHPRFPLKRVRPLPW